MKKLLFGVASSVLIIGASSIPAFASNAGDGSDWGTQPGYSVASGNTACADHGSFDAFGKGANLGIDYSPGNGDQQHATFLQSYPGPGTDGYQTGLNNSGLCGNRE